MIIESHNKDDIKVIKIIGQVDMSNYKEFQDSLDRSIEGTKKVVLDLEELTYLNSMGLGTIVKVYSSLKKQRIELRLCSLRKEINKLFSITKLDSLIKIYKDLEEAMNDF